MKKLWLGIFVAASLSIAGSIPAMAQSACQYIATGNVLTAAQWNSCFQAKQNVLGYAPVNRAGDTMLGKFTTQASQVSSAGFNIPQGSAPATPQNGDVWTTLSGMYARINGVTIGPFAGSGEGTFAANNPLRVTFPAGIVTYALAYDSNFGLSGSNQLALANIASGSLLANCGASPAEPTGCAWTAFADRAISSSNGSFPYRIAGSWGTIASGTTGGTVPLNNTANVFSAVQSVNTNAAPAPSPLTGTLLNVTQADAVNARVQVNSFGAVAFFSGVAYGGTSSLATAITSGTQITGFNAHAYNGATVVGPVASFRMYAAQNFSAGNQGSKACVATTPISSTTMADVICAENDAGVTVGSPTGGSQGAGKLNAVGLYVNGVAVGLGNAITALTGDVTATGPGSVAATIAANAVTYAKFQQVAASSLVGNPTGTLANAQGITLGATLAFSGTALQTNAGTGDITWSANSFATTLATVNSNVGTCGSSTAIPTVTLNAKGLSTACTTNVVIAPAGTLTGTALASNVVTSSLTSVGTLTGGATGAGFTIALSTSTLTGQVGLTNLPTIGASTVLGSIAGGTPIALTTTQHTSLVNLATATLSGALPAFPNTTTTYFRGDGSYQTLNCAAISGAGTGCSASAGITALTGDVTATGPGSSAATIAANAVTYAKFQQVAASSLVGNATGTLANATGVTLGATLAFSGSALQTVAGTGDVTWSANSFATTIAANAVTYAKFQQVAASSIVGNATGVTANATGITLGATLAFSSAVLQTGAGTGDVTWSANSFSTTLATVNSNVGTCGSSTGIPTITLNAKGLATACTTNAVIAPAGTLSGTTMNATVVTSSLTSVGTLTGGATGAGFTIALTTSTVTGTLPAANFPALTGDVTTAGGALATTIANNAVTNAKSAQMASVTLKGNPTNAMANASDFTLAGLTQSTVPDVTNDMLLIWDSAGGTFKKINPTTIASSSVAGVASIAGNVGAFSLSTGITNFVNDIRLASIAADNLLMNSTGSSAAPIATAVVNCTGAAKGLTYDTSAHTFGCTTNTVGTVTSVGFTGGIITVATATTTPAFTVAGTSGGIPYFDTSSSWATSAALAANSLVKGGGAGVAPSTITTGTGVLTALGVDVGSAGAFVTFNGALGTPLSVTLTSATGLPLSTGITGFGSGIATALAVNTGTAGAPGILIANGSKALATSAIASGACSSAQTDTATGAATTDAASYTFAADYTGTTGYVPSTSGMLTILPWITSGTMNFKVCNNTSASITPGAVTVNWRIVR